MKLRYLIKPPCKKCPYKLSMIQFVENPCPACKTENYRTYDILKKTRNYNQRGGENNLPASHFLYVPLYILNMNKQQKNIQEAFIYGKKSYYCSKSRSGRRYRIGIHGNLLFQQLRVHTREFDLNTVCSQTRGGGIAKKQKI